MKRVLIVGSNGFAGRYLKQELLFHGYEVYGVDRVAFDEHTYAADMLLREEVDHIIKKVRPDGIFNLSGFASPHLSWKHVTETLRLNVEISVNLALSIRDFFPMTRLVLIGTSNQYDVEACDNKPIDENSPRKAEDPYSISKQAQEDLLMMLAHKYDIDIVFTRSFNHIGPGQKRSFVVTDFASGIVDVERGRREALEVGNLDQWRDFSDVRDSVRAYRMLYEKGHRKEIYNVGSGQTKQIAWILATLLSYSTKKIPIIHKQIQSSSSYRVICNYQKLKVHTGYEPKINIEETLLDVLNYYRNVPEDLDEGASYGR